MRTNFDNLAKVLLEEDLHIVSIRADENGMEFSCLTGSRPVESETLIEFFRRYAAAWGREVALQRLNTALSDALNVTLDPPVIPTFVIDRDGRPVLNLAVEHSRSQEPQQ